MLKLCIYFSLEVLQILLPVFLKVPAAMDCIFRNLYGKLYLHQYLGIDRNDGNNVQSKGTVLNHTQGECEWKRI